MPDLIFLNTSIQVSYLRIAYCTVCGIVPAVDLTGFKTSIFCHRDQLHEQVKALGLAYVRGNTELNHPGWGKDLMLDINATFPHPDHLFINLGLPGYSFHQMSEASCFEDMLPASVDLLILQ